MLHLVSVPHFAGTPEPSAGALAKLAGIRRALRLVDQFGGGPASDLCYDEIPIAWTGGSKAGSGRFDDCTLRAAGAAAAGIEPDDAAGRRLAEAIRLGLEDLSRRMRQG